MTPAYAAKAVGRGFDLVTISNDVRLLAGAAQASVAAARKLIGDQADESDQRTGKGSLLKDAAHPRRGYNSRVEYVLHSAAPGVTFDMVSEVSTEFYAPLVGNADAVLFRTQPMPAEVIGKAERSKIVSRHVTTPSTSTPQ